MEIILGILAVARLTEIIVYEKIAIGFRSYFGIFYNPRTETNMLMEGDNKVKNFIGNMLSCYSCATVWVSMFVLGMYYIWKPVFIVFALWMTLSYIAVKLDTINDLIESYIK